MMGRSEVESHPLLYLIVGDDLARWVLLIGWSDFEPERDRSVLLSRGANKRQQAIDTSFLSLIKVKKAQRYFFITESEVCPLWIRAKLFRPMLGTGPPALAFGRSRASPTIQLHAAV